MRHIPTVTVMFMIFAFVVATIPAPVWADNPHSISDGTALILSSGAYQVANFKEAGPGSGVLRPVTSPEFAELKDKGPRTKNQGQRTRNEGKSKKHHRIG